MARGDGVDHRRELVDAGDAEPAAFVRMHAHDVEATVAPGEPPARTEEQPEHRAVDDIYRRDVDRHGVVVLHEQALERGVPTADELAIDCSRERQHRHPVAELQRQPGSVTRGLLRLRHRELPRSMGSVASVPGAPIFRHRARLRLGGGASA